MKRYWPVMMVLMAGCGSNPEYDLEVDSVTACERAVKQNLTASSSYEPDSRWLFSMQNSDGVIGRNYSATNGFGARVDAKYFCQYDPDTRSIVYLMVEEPTGTRFLIAR